jgi:hypothetical protein
MNFSRQEAWQLRGGQAKRSDGKRRSQPARTSADRATARKEPIHDGEDDIVAGLALVR